MMQHQLDQLASGPAPGKALLSGDRPDRPDLAPVDQLLEIHEYERQRMGQELHDSAGQLLVALQFSIAQLKRVEAGGSHVELVDEIQHTVQQIDQEIRTLAFLHYPVELGDHGLISAVRSLARNFGRRTGIRTSFKTSGDQSIANETASKALLRVAQEALVNVHRHAHASQASIVLKRMADRLELLVSDDGIGMPSAVSPARARGIGLRGMRHRIEALGGRFEVRNLKQGTRLSAVVPIGA
jgi:signal transduction histidine kinase